MSLSIPSIFGNRSFAIAVAATTFYIKALWNAANQDFAKDQIVDTLAEGVNIGALTAGSTTTVTPLAPSIIGNRLYCTRNVTGGREYMWTRVGNNQGFPLSAGIAMGITSVTRNGTPISMHTTEHTAGGYAYLMCAYTYATSIGFNCLYNITAYTDIISTDTVNLVGILGGFDANGTPYTSGDKSSFIYGTTFYAKKSTESSWKRVSTSLLLTRAASGTGYICISYPGTNYTNEVTDNLLVFNDETFSSKAFVPSVYEATPANGFTFTHTADFSFVFKLVSTTFHIKFRKQDANNYWDLFCDATNMYLREIVGGAAPVVRQTLVNSINAFYNITCIGSVMCLKYATVSGDSGAGIFNSSGNFATATSGEITLGSGVNKFSVFPVFNSEIDSALANITDLVS